MKKNIIFADEDDGEETPLKRPTGNDQCVPSDASQQNIPQLKRFHSFNPSVPVTKRQRTDTSDSCIPDLSYDYKLTEDGESEVVMILGTEDKSVQGGGGDENERTTFHDSQPFEMGLVPSVGRSQENSMSNEVTE